VGLYGKNRDEFRGSLKGHQDVGSQEVVTPNASAVVWPVILGPGALNSDDGGKGLQPGRICSTPLFEETILNLAAKISYSFQRMFGVITSFRGGCLTED